MDVHGLNFLSGSWVPTTAGDKSPLFLSHSEIQKVVINGVINEGVARAAAKLKLTKFSKIFNNIGGVLES